MSPRLTISAGELFEWMTPAAFALTAFISAWVLASARRHRFRATTITLWTLGTLFLPLIILPLYLIARSRRALEREQKIVDAHENSDEKDDDTENEALEPEASVDEKDARVIWRKALPLSYLIIILSLGALYFYTDSRSVDAHLARANQARVRGQSEHVIKEYRAALALEDSAHTHNLLGLELLWMKRWEEALAELRAAERMNEPDDELPYNIAEALYNLNRRADAILQYEKFLSGPLCSEPPPDTRCNVARSRLNDAGNE